MQSVNYRLPAQCGECGEFFDLRFDRTFLKEAREESEARGKLKQPILCWDCRS